MCSFIIRAAAASVMSAAVSVVGIASASASTLVIGVGVGGNGTGYIGDTTGYANVGSNFSTAGTAPVRAGTSKTWVVRYFNSGNVPESLRIQQSTPSWLGGTPVPAGWVTFTPASSASLAPEAHVDVTVTVKVPAAAKAGRYTGVLSGTANSVAKTSGNITMAVGAGDREYIRVP